MAERKYESAAARQRAYRSRKDAREAGRLAMLNEIDAMLQMREVPDEMTADGIRRMLVAWKARDQAGRKRSEE